jgi:hypothetical protein
MLRWETITPFGRPVVPLDVRNPFKKDKRKEKEKKKRKK